MTISETLKEKRIKSGMTQKDLAEKIGVTQKDISRWENGKFNPKTDKLKKIADALGVGIEELI